MQTVDGVKMCLALFATVALAGLCAAEAYPLRTDDLRIRDPFVVAEAGTYFLYESTPWEGGSGVNVFESKDLVHWSERKSVMTIPETVGATAVWAPEVHHYRGKWYLFVTLTLKPGAWEIRPMPTDGFGLGKLQPRGTWIYVSDSLLGPFVPVKDGSVTPKDWMCLDGTFFEEDGKPYMIFCHEWCQVGDGRMMLAELKPDLSDIVGEPKELFRASSVGKRFRVTDGPFLHRCPGTGTLLMTWSNAGDEGYSVYLKKSESGSVRGPWRNAGKLFSKDGGHGMMFKDFKGKLQFALHQPNKSPLERMKVFPVRESADTIAIGSAVAPSRFVQLKPGAVKPQGWLREQLRLQADGLTGHAEELYDDIGKSTWLTREPAKDPQYDWERGPYYARGLLALAWQLDDAKLKERARRWVAAILDGQLPNGDFGPRRENWWANMLALYIVRDWYRISGDVRCLDFIAGYARFLQTALLKTPLMADFGDRKGGPPWAAARGGDMLEVFLDAYDETKDETLLDAARLVASQTAPWTDYYHDGTPNWAYQQHIVNFNQGLKTPAHLWRLCIGDADRSRSAYRAATAADGWVQRAFGRPDAMQNGEEPLRDRETTGGTELCAQAERLISCADQIAVFGDALAADDLETVAYNCLPATLAPDGKGLRYYLNLNQPKCTNERTGYCNNGQRENCLVPSPHSGFGCCRSNFHIAWPKFVQSMWMKVVGGGYAAVAYGPCRLETDEVTFVEKTDYPFRGRITLTVEKGGGRFPIYVRVPKWTKEPDAGSFRRIDRQWRPGEEVVLDFASEPKLEKGWNRNSAVVRKGPLLFAWPVKNKEKVTADFGNGFVTRQLIPDGAFNVALDLREGFHPDVVDDGGRLPSQPFTVDAAPIRLRVKGCRTREAEWGQFRIGTPELPNEPPPSPIRKAVDFGLIDLVPLGCTQTRMTFFPWTDSDQTTNRNGVAGSIETWVELRHEKEGVSERVNGGQGVSLESFRPGEVAVGGEIGRRMSITISHVMNDIDVDREFVRHFRVRKEKPDAYDGFTGWGMLLDAIVKAAAHGVGGDSVRRFKERCIADTIATQTQDGNISIFAGKLGLWDSHEQGYMMQAFCRDWEWFGNRKSFDAARKLGDYMLSTKAPLLAGMCPAYTYLYRMTGDGRYLAWLRQGAVVEQDDAAYVEKVPINGVDHVYGHLERAFQQLEYALVTGRRFPTLEDSARCILRKLAGDYLSVTGTLGGLPNLGEYWDDSQIGQQPWGETCASAYLMRFLAQWMKFHPDVPCGDLYERIMYNALFGAQSHDGRRQRYFSPFNQPGEWYARDGYCCPNNLRRIMFEIPDAVFLKTANGFAVNLFAPAELKTEGLEVSMKTSYPDEGRVSWRIKSKRAGRMDVRIPLWTKLADAGNWRTFCYPVGESSFDVEFPMVIRLIKGRKAQSGRVALMRGPIVYEVEEGGAYIDCWKFDVSKPMVFREGHVEVVMLDDHYNRPRHNVRLAPFASEKRKRVYFPTTGEGTLEPVEDEFFGCAAFLSGSQVR